MDVYKKSRWPNRQILFVSAFIIILCGYLSFRTSFSESPDTSELSIDDITLDVVQKGKFEIKLNAYGSLISNTRRLLTAQNSAVVEEILLRPGSAIEVGSVILKLQSPELREASQTLNQAYLSAVANKRYLKLEQEQQLLEETLSLQQLKSKLKSLSFNASEVEKLANLGVISKFEHLEMVAEQEEVQTSIRISEVKLDKMHALHTEALEIQDTQIAQARASLQAVKEKIERLTVTADTNGVVQELHVELGQSVGAGDQLVTVSRTDNLVASMNVPQNQAADLQLKQQAWINIGDAVVGGKVTRIDSAVKEGTVAVEVALTAPLPTAARPSLAVDGYIVASGFEDTLFVSRPANALAHRKQLLYKLNDGKSKAHPVQVTLGADNGTYIQILGGAQKGDTLIVSNTSHLKKTKEINVLQ